MRSIFRNLGVNNDDQKIYLKMLELGPQSVSVAAKFNNIPRSSMYVVVDRLKKVWIVREFEKFGKKYVEAISPDELRGLIIKKQKALDSSLEDLDENIDSLKSMSNSFSARPTIYIYEWLEQVKKGYSRIASNTKQLSTIFNPQVLHEYSDDMVDIFIQETQARVLTVKELLVQWDVWEEYKDKYS